MSEIENHRVSVRRQEDVNVNLAPAGSVMERHAQTIIQLVIVALLTGVVTIVYSTSQVAARTDERTKNMQSTFTGFREELKSLKNDAFPRTEATFLVRAWDDLSDRVKELEKEKR